MKQGFTWAMGLVGASLLAACGGGDDYVAPVVPPVVPPVVTEVPGSASASSLAYTQYATTLNASETVEPLSVDTVAAAPVSETDDPIAIN